MYQNILATVMLANSPEQYFSHNVYFWVFYHG